MRKPNVLVATALGLLASAVFVQRRTARAERADHVRGSFIDIDGVRLHYVERGSGPALVLVHGLGSMIDDFVLSGLFNRAASQFRVIAIDRPGYGGSTRPRMAPGRRFWSPAAQADLLQRTLHELDVHRPVLFGHSFGATVALAYAMRHPVERLVIASGYYYPSARLDAPLLVPPAIPLVGDAMRYTISPLVGRALWPAWLRLLFGPRPVPRRFRAFPTWLALRPLQLRAIGEDAAVLLPSVMQMRAGYRDVAVPTTIVCGGGDRYISARAQSMRLHAEMPGSRLVVVPGAGHMVHYAAPEEIMHAIRGDVPAQRLLDVP